MQPKARHTIKGVLQEKSVDSDGDMRDDNLEAKRYFSHLLD